MRRLLLLALTLALPLALGAADRPPGGSFLPKTQPKKYDLNALRAEVDESQALFEGLARESRALSPAAKAALVEALATDFSLPERRGRASASMQDAEEVVEAREALKAAEKALDAVGDGEPRARARAALDSAKGDLAGEVESLRDGLRSMHKDYGEAEVRALRNWAAVSQGLLERKRLGLVLPTPTPAPRPTPQPARPLPPRKPAQAKH